MSSIVLPLDGRALGGLFDDLLVGKALVYLVGGFLAFRYATELARQRGVLGHH